MRRFLWFVLPVLGAILLLLVITRFPQLRPQFSYWLKHTPLCLAENMGLIKPTRAYYSESLQTTMDILRCAPSKPPQLVGGDMNDDLIVVSDLGGLVQRFDKSGELIWQTELNLPRGIHIHEDKVYVGEGRRLLQLNINSGQVLKSYEFDYPINNSFMQGNKLYILYDLIGSNSVQAFEILENDLKLFSSSKFITKYARGLYVDENYVYVSDTYGHRILKLEKDTLEKIDETSARFPMGLLSYRGKLIVAEDLNIINKFNYNSMTRVGPYVGCRRKTKMHELKNAEDMVYCMKENMQEELYSPNDVDVNDKYTYVADTHNHRLVIFFENKAVSWITGFNNPVNIRIIRN